MKEIELSALISQGEGFHLEFKESVNSSFAKELSAFANAKGGLILVGVNDNGKVLKRILDNSDKSKIESSARDCDPSIEIKIESVENQPGVLAIHVPKGLNKPYRCTNGFYMREGASSVKRKTLEIKEMFNDSAWFSFDDQLCKRAIFDEVFSSKNLKRFFAESGKVQMLADEDSLFNLGVLESIDDTLIFNNTGVLFFASNPTQLLPHSMIQCVRYNGIEKVFIEDQLNLQSDIFTNIDDAFSFLRKSLSVRFEFEEGNPRRNEVWEVPFIALKEAVINAIAHRDYVHKGSHIQIEVFDDRVSITNYGGLLKGLTKKDLGKRSLHRNPNIVNILHQSNYIEKLGTGIKRIAIELNRVGLPEATFEVSEHWFTIIFKRVNNRIYESTNVDLSKRDISILEYCEKSKSRFEILQFIGISNTTRNYENNIKPLVDKGLLKREQESVSAPNQSYMITSKGRNALSMH